MTFSRTLRRPSTLIAAAAALSALALTACSANEKASTAPTSTASNSTASASTAPATNASSTTRPVSDTTELSGKSFTATEVTGHALVDGSELVLEFEGDMIAVQAGCNNMNGGYTFDGATLEVPMLAGTMMACEPELMDQDQWVSAFLAAGPDAEVAGDTLTLASGETTIVLTKS